MNLCALRLCLLVLWFVLAAGSAGAAPSGAFTVALAAVGEGSAFPQAAATRVTLPDDWARTRPASRGPVWYRVIFHADAESADRLLALYVAQVCTNLEVYLNRALVASGGRMIEPVTPNCERPQLISLPAALVTPGENRLDIKVTSYPRSELASRSRSGYLSVLEIGPHAALADRHAQATTLTVVVPLALGATLLLLGSFMFVLGFVQRRHSHLAYFGALAFGWALLDLRLWWQMPWLPNAMAEFLLAAIWPFITLAATQFLLRYAGERRRWVDNALPLQCVLMPLTLVLAGTQRLNAAATLWYLAFAAQAVAAGVFCLRRLWQRRRHAFWLMAAVLGLALAAGAVELAEQAFGWRGVPTQVAHLALPLGFGLIGLRLVHHQGRALIEAEEDRAKLEQRINAATAEIERNFRQLAEMRVEQVTERERKRIAADLHDDLGAKLLTIVHTSDSERISTLAREALEEMRLSVRGLTGRPVQLSDALGDWRAEIVSRLSQAGIEAEWAAPDDLADRLSARAYVQTTRILREATSNIIKHSGASRCTVRCDISQGDFHLVMQDNGQGIDTEVEGRLDRGHGLASMKQRAKQLQGQCLVESATGYGTVIRLTLPMDRALAGA
jgi:signal transduction histidine kinase